jgi:hypothetical protein
MNALLAVVVRHSGAGFTPAIRSRLLSFSLPLLFSLSTLSAAAKPALTDVRVYPADINLRTSGDRQSIVVQATYADGVTRDVTAESSFALANKKLAHLGVTATGSTLTPLADGTTELRVKFSGKTLNVPVVVASAKTAEPISFVRDVMPVFTKAGCNTGGCHAKAGNGQNGFRLSLFGFEPQEDFEHIVKEGRGRRVFPAAPEKSLLLLKATNTTPHGGGRKIVAGSEDYQTLVGWIAQGMPFALAGDDDRYQAEVMRLAPAPKFSPRQAAQTAARDAGRGD